MHTRSVPTRYLTEWGQVQVHTYQYLKTSIYDQVCTLTYLFRQILLGYRALVRTVEELLRLRQRIRRRLSLLRGNGADCGQNGAIDRSTVEEELPADLLYEFFVRRADRRRVDPRCRILFSGAVFDRRARVRRVLAFQWSPMVELF